MRNIKTHEYFLKRRAGVLLHPTSIPVGSGQGVLGEAATRFIDFLVKGGFSMWQMLPVQPVDEFSSPYQCTSAHAGNPDFICKQKLAENSWMNMDGHPVDVDPSRLTLDAIGESLIKFEKFSSASQQSEFTSFKHANWLEDYALFCAIKAVHGGKPWWEWPHELCCRDEITLDNFRLNHTQQLERTCFEQFIFFSQWRDVHQQARDKNILLFGDMPMFTAHDSVDVWVHQRYFKLDDKGQPTVVAGVPPDYFSATGQRWGNPVYNWEALSRDKFLWWLERLDTQ
ncbi:MAG: 4-alpha-glucanotransferase, partial [Gammaproteobacteria bacterium]